METSEQIVLRFTRWAQKLRAIAANVKEPESREAMLAWAADCDRVAERAIEAGTFFEHRESNGGGCDSPSATQSLRQGNASKF